MLLLVVICLVSFSLKQFLSLSMIFMILTFFKDYEPVILQNIIQFGFVQCLFMARPKVFGVGWRIPIVGLFFILYSIAWHVTLICPVTKAINLDDLVKMASGRFRPCEVSSPFSINKNFVGRYFGTLQNSPLMPFLSTSLLND